jgi:uncharacterized membrane protein YeaQ/YmgE (transglycosylase-associated protein family)
MLHLIWIGLIGLIVGALAKAVMPGKDPGGIFVTMALGITGSLVAGLRPGYRFGTRKVKRLDSSCRLRVQFSCSSYIASISPRQRKVQAERSADL